jgi:hypothetical protein
MQLLDYEGYPTEELLNYIATVRMDQSHEEILELAKSVWCYPDYVWVDGEDTKVYTFRTAGWSGNESLIHAMRENVLFWSFCWEESKRGGIHTFKVKRLPR